MMCSKRHQKGFTLIELSLVLVIIGLIIGAVVTGQSLIRSAELNKAVSQVQQYQAAMHAFRTKYSGIPGDLADATAYWGTRAGCPVSPIPGQGVGTCNGDGNGQLSGVTFETLYFWDHLERANFIKAEYRPNIPYFPAFVASASASDSATTLLGGITIGWPVSAEYYPIDDVYWFDLKVDDGEPDGGRVIVTDPGDPTTFCEIAPTYLIIELTTPFWVCDMYYQL